MKRGAVKTKPVFFLIAAFVVLTTTSGYLYHQNKNYQYENRRLIILNDSILSENVELKNALQQKESSAGVKTDAGNFKTRKTK